MFQVCFKSVKLSFKWASTVFNSSPMGVLEKFEWCFCFEDLEG